MAWTMIILNFHKYRQDEVDLNLYQEMKQIGIDLDHFALVSILPTGDNMGDVEDGKEVHKEIARMGYEFNLFLGCTGVDMYVKCREIDIACNFFDYYYLDYNDFCLF